MIFDDTYNTITSQSEGLFKAKGSKFIALVFPVISVAEVKTILEGLRKQYYDARHHCYAYRLDYDKPVYRINDDGEPSGTAGKPIYGQILSADLTNILIVVIRYFGGTKLGISGLIKAYKTVTKNALENSKIITKTVNDVYELVFDYSLMNDVMKVLKEEKLEQLKNRYAVECKITFSVRKSNSIRIYDKFSKIMRLKINYLHTV